MRLFVQCMPACCLQGFVVLCVCVQLLDALHFYTCACMCSLRSEIEKVKTLENNENFLVYGLNVNNDKDTVLLHHVRGFVGDMVPMRAWFALPEQYRARADTALYVYVSSWRVVDFHICSQGTSVSDCICYNIPYGAQRGVLTLEAVNMGTLPLQFVCNGKVPSVRLRIFEVPLQAGLDWFARLCFMQRTICTLCCDRQAKHKSIEACSKPAKKGIWCALCDLCLNELFVKVKKCGSDNWRPKTWVLDLEAKDELYFFSRVQKKISEFGAQEKPRCGIYALKDEVALAQGFGSWHALYVYKRRQKAAKQKKGK